MPVAVASRLHAVAWPASAGYLFVEDFALCDLVDGVLKGLRVRRAVAVSSRTGPEVYR